jgi:diguanylate cyclase (GGDEF)-like protein/PAS domain S-box-containing protein
MPRKRQILIVDDTPASLKLLSDLLKAEGFDVRSALCGELALEAAAHYPPDLVLLDIMMPGMDGFEVCRRLKADQRTSAIPVLFISALTDTQEKLDGFRLGAVDFVTKPFCREELLARVQTHLEIGLLRHHLEDRVEERSRQLLASQAQLKATLNDLEIANAHLHTLLRTIPDLVWLKDPDGIFLACNRQTERWLGAAEEDIVGKTDYDFVAAELAERFRNDDRQALEHNNVYADENRLTFASDGYQGIFEILNTPMRDQKGQLIGVLGIARDISERKNAEVRIRRQMQLYATLSQCNKALLHCRGEEELFARICRVATELDGIRAAWIGRMENDTGPLKLVATFGAEAPSGRIEIGSASPYGSGPVAESLRNLEPSWCEALEHDPVATLWSTHNRGAWVASAALPLSFGQTDVGVLVLYADHIDRFDYATRDLLVEMADEINFALETFHREYARQRAEAKVERLVFYDPLTNLPNRRLLHDRVSHALAVATRSNGHGAILFVGLDDFKTLNDSKGHAVGDLLLIEVAKRIQACVREDDSVARLGGDQFVVVLNGLAETLAQASQQAQDVAEHVLAAIGQPYWLEHWQYHCSASAGITMFYADKHSAEELLQYTETAMYKAKSAGRNSILFYNPSMQVDLEKRTVLENDLRSALRQQQFVLFYQMQVDQHGGIQGAETLIRWQHPSRGLVSPLEFITLAEKNGLILPIGQWVLETACSQLKAWEGDARMRGLTLAVNVSASQFHQPDFVDLVKRVLNAYDLAPNRLKLELTESLVLGDIDDAIVKMHQLRQLGVRFSVDDFGTGYSSLSYLTKLPIDQLKIDKSFVRNIRVTPSDTVIVQTILGMAENLGLECIAEGVETQEQHAFLLQHGCKQFQGYLFSMPLPLADFEVRVVAGKASY